MREAGAAGSSSRGDRQGWSRSNSRSPLSSRRRTPRNHHQLLSLSGCCCMPSLVTVLLDAAAQCQSRPVACSLTAALFSSSCRPLCFSGLWFRGEAPSSLLWALSCVRPAHGALDPALGLEHSSSAPCVGFHARFPRRFALDAGQSGQDLSDRQRVSTTALKTPGSVLIRLGEAALTAPSRCP